MMTTAWLRLFAGASALALGSAAFAQDTPTAPESATTNQAEEQEPAAIIVTAQKREQRLQDVPLTISVISAEQLERQSITNIQDAQNATPELNFVGQPSSGYSIRGSGTSTFSRSAENNVLVVVDGVVLGQLTPPTNSLFDLAQIEVLSGPQGMLFGKNASAGVVNIITNRPSTARQSFLARLSIGEDGYLVNNLMGNVPLGDNAAVRVTFAHDRRDGVTFNRFNNRRIDDFKNSAFRARLLWEPTAALTLNLIGDIERQKGGNNAWTSRVAPNTSPTSIGGRLAACGVTPGPENNEVCLDGPTDRDVEGAGASVQADLDLGGSTLTSITAYRSYTREVNTDSDTRPINGLNVNKVNDDIDQWTQELRIANSQSDRLTYVAGVFFFDYHFRVVNPQAGTFGVLPFVATRTFTDDVTQRSFALFGQAEYALTPQFTIIAGGRQTWDKLRLANRFFVDPALGIRFPPLSPAVDTVGERKVNTDNFSYRLGLQFEPSRELTFFATYSKGYKGPAINNTAALGAAPPVVRSEIPRNIEVGAKTTLINGKVRADVSLFDMRVKDFQTQTSVVANGLTQFVFANASRLNFRGAQVNLYANPLKGVNLNAGMLYNKATYGDFIVQCNAPFLAGCTSSGGANVINARGRQLANAPKWKFNIGGGIEQPLSARLAGFVDGNLVYRSKINTSPTPDPNLVIPAYSLVDARVGVKDVDDRWLISAFAKNLFDERAAGFIFRDPLSPTGNYNQSFASNAFRTIGLTLEVRY